MGKKQQTAISPTRAENYPEWYQQVIKAADLAESSPVRGCMVIKPWGYGIWERIQRLLDDRFKETGHENAYFPLFIPLRFFEKEAEHVEGFAKECAVVTHHRLEPDGNGGLKPGGPLEEPLVVRPTSETIIGDSFSRWIQSHRDLPVLINQWANVVRWEMRTRIFLRTSEFLWQEGHTAHATADEAIEETRLMHRVYAEFSRDVLAMAPVPGEKSAIERFPGALQSYTIECLMQDGKSLQAGTSHFLGQNFAKAQEITFQDENNNEAYCWTTSWGVSTRLIGGLIMTHSDDDGLRLPPRVAPRQVVLIPIAPKEADAAKVMPYVDEIEKRLKALTWDGEKIRVTVDRRDIRGGEKSWSWIKKGIPVRLEIGPRDVDEGKVCLKRRDHEVRDKEFLTIDELAGRLPGILTEIHDNLYSAALAHREANTVRLQSNSEFIDYFKTESPGFAFVPWSGNDVLEKKLSDDLKISIRCLPLEQEDVSGQECVGGGGKATQLAVWARSY